MDRKFENAFHTFVSLERAHNLSDVTINEIHIWRLVRATVFNRYCEDQEIFIKSESQIAPLKSRLLMRVSRTIAQLGKKRPAPASSSTFPQSRHMVRLKSAGSKLLKLPIAARTLISLIWAKRTKVIILPFGRHIAESYRLTQPIEDSYRGRSLTIEKNSTSLFGGGEFDQSTIGFIAKHFFKMPKKEKEIFRSSCKAFAAKYSSIFDQPESFIEKSAFSNGLRFYS
ncbi:MAG: hypothetical protein WBC71_04440 [Salaquimonas sp.]